MLIESTVPLRVKTQGREIILEPGKPVELPPEQAEKLLRVAPDTVRPVLEPGDTVHWDSPLFGPLSGELVAVAHETFSIWHPLTERLCEIPRAWIVHAHGLNGDGAR